MSFFLIIPWICLLFNVSIFCIAVQDNFATIKESIASQTELMMSQTYKEMKDNEAKVNKI